MTTRDSLFAAAVFLILAVPVPAPGCLQHIDMHVDEKVLDMSGRVPRTGGLVRGEAAGARGVIWAITGRFNRYPPEYYQARLARIEAELKNDPTDLNAYDDAAVACDRLHRSHDAIRWMERKLAEMERMERSGIDQKNHRYRYLANLGTFYVHRWARSPENQGDLTDLVHGRDLIREAIRINPDAHFGREKYQLNALEWLVETRRPGKAVALNGARELPAFTDGAADLGTPDQVMQGLAGLVVLGDAWNSVDVYNALAKALHASGRLRMAYYAAERAAELARAGKRSLYPGAPAGNELALLVLGPYVMRAAELEGIPAYTDLRKEAAQWHQHRTAYLTARLKEGRHPDTDTTFWRDFQDTPQPDLGRLVPVPWKDPEVIWSYARVPLAGVGLLLGAGLLRLLVPLGLRRVMRRA